MEKNREGFLSALREKTIQNRAKADITLINEEERTIPFIIVSNDNAGLRYDWWNDEVFEERLDPAGASFDSLNTFFKDHVRNTDTAIGKVESTKLESGQIKSIVRFGADEDSLKIFNKFRDGILTDVSIGYNIEEVITTERKDEPTEVLVTKFDIIELSAVWRGFDSKAKVGREKEDIKEDEVKEKAEAEKRHKRMQRKLKVINLSHSTGSSI